MSLHVSIIMIKSDVTQTAKSIFESFNYICPKSPSLSSSWNDVCESFVYPKKGRDRNIVSKSVSLINGWTVILDPELVLATESDQWRQLSIQINVPIFTMICEGSSGTYSFFYTNESNSRSFFSIAGEVHENSGEKIPQEIGINLESVFEDEILLVMEKLGVKFSDIENAFEYYIWELDESNMGPTPEDLAKFDEWQNKQKKPWWKFWV